MRTYTIIYRQGVGTHKQITRIEATNEEQLFTKLSNRCIEKERVISIKAGD